MKPCSLIIKIVSLLWIFLCVPYRSIAATPREFSYTYQHQTVKYRVVSEESKTCITCPGVFTQTITPPNHIYGDLIIPEIVKDGNKEYTVIGIGEGSFFNNSIKNLTLPKSVTTIQQHAFEGCGQLQKVVLPDSLKIIEDWAFSGCVKLPCLNLPFSVSSIGTGAFTSCISLTFFIIPNNVSIINSYTFRDCRKLEKVIIPNSVIYLGMEAFAHCTYLKSVFLPGSIKYIEERAFMDCQNLTSLYYEELPKYVPTNAFQQSNKVRKIEVNSDFSMHPSSINLKVGETQEILVSDPEVLGHPDLISLNALSFNNSFQFLEENIISGDLYSSGSLLINGESPGYALLQYVSYDREKAIRSIGICYITVIDATTGESSVKEVTVESPFESDEKYYDINGRPINYNEFTKGIVIRHKNGKAEKIYIR